MKYFFLIVFLPSVVFSHMPNMKNFKNLVNETIDGKKAYEHFEIDFLEMEFVETEKVGFFEAYDKITKCYFRVYIPTLSYPHLQTRCELEDENGQVYVSKNYKIKHKKLSDLYEFIFIEDGKVNKFLLYDSDFRYNYKKGIVG
jgi:hypothetical protein